MCEGERWQLQLCCHNKVNPQSGEVVNLNGDILWRDQARLSRPPRGRDATGAESLLLPKEAFVRQLPPWLSQVEELVAIWADKIATNGFILLKQQQQRC